MLHQDKNLNDEEIVTTLQKEASDLKKYGLELGKEKEWFKEVAPQVYLFRVTN